MDVLVPDIGDFKDVPVIEVLVKPGDRVEKDAPLLTLESDKATMEIPSPAGGVVRSVAVKVGDKVSQGTKVAVLEEEGRASGVGPQASGQQRAATPERPATPEHPVAESRGGTPPSEQVRPERPYSEHAPATPRKDYGGPTETVPPPQQGPPSVAPPVIDEEAFRRAHAGPMVRKLARELGVDLGQVRGSGPKSRILPDDVKAFVKSVISGAAAPAAVGAGLSVAPWPKVDFAKFGPVETKPLTRIQKIA